jgi:uncharacterized Zn-binding protein involved in type VI secretion
MSKAVALKGHNHICPLVDPGPKPHIGGPISSCQQSFVTFNGIPLALVGDKLTCVGSSSEDSIASGSSCVTINGIPVARIGDPTTHGGIIVGGEASLTMD